MSKPAYDPDNPDVGTFRHRVSYQVASSPVDAFNESVDSWTTLGTFWCCVRPLVGMELMNARQLKATTGHKLTMRNVNSALAPLSITPSGRFVFEATGRVLGIDQVFRLGERNAFLAIHCSELITPQ